LQTNFVWIPEWCTFVTADLIGGALRIYRVRETGAVISIYHTHKFLGNSTTGAVNAADSIKRSFTTARARLTQASSVRADVAALNWLLWVASDRIANELAT
jgi:hypothetical protein